MFKVQWRVNLDEYHRLSQFILASANLYCIFQITFMYHIVCSSLCTFKYHVLYISLCIFTLQFPCFSFFVIDRTRKQALLIKRFNFVLSKIYQGSVIQTNELQLLKMKTAEKFKRTSCNGWKIKIVTFFFEVYFEGGAPKIYINQLKDISNGVHFFDKIAGWRSANLPKNASIFHNFCSDL